MLWLGFWQLDKWELRQQQLDAFNAADLNPITIDDLQDPVAQQFATIRVAGRLLGERQLLIDNIVRESRNGFFVVTPFRLEDGGTLLVNRGWIPQTPRREPIGDLEITPEERTLIGRIGRLPTGGLRLGENGTDIRQWPAIVQYPQMAEVEAMLQEPLQTWVLLLDPQADAGFSRDWTPPGLPPERHLGYAVQWFALSAALTLLLMITALRRRKTGPAQ